jgi:hypothetical protein
LKIFKTDFNETTVFFKLFSVLSLNIFRKIFKKNKKINLLKKLKFNIFILRSKLIKINILNLFVSHINLSTLLFKKYNIFFKNILYFNLFIKSVALLLDTMKCLCG